MCQRCPWEFWAYTAQKRERPSFTQKPQRSNSPSLIGRLFSLWLRDRILSLTCLGHVLMPEPKEAGTVPLSPKVTVSWSIRCDLAERGNGSDRGTLYKVQTTFSDSLSLRDRNDTWGPLCMRLKTPMSSLSRMHYDLPNHLLTTACGPRINTSRNNSVCLVPVLWQKEDKRVLESVLNILLYV